jgi:predicted nucleic acid-binding protein
MRITATTLAKGAQLATRNTAGFNAIAMELIHPWTADRGKHP